MIICEYCYSEVDNESELKTVMVEDEVNSKVLEERLACTECGHHEYLIKEPYN